MVALSFFPKLEFPPQSWFVNDGYESCAISSTVRCSVSRMRANRGDGCSDLLFMQDLCMFEVHVFFYMMSSNFCPHLIFKFGDLIEFSVLKD